jgi:hypothetical protein
MGPLKNYYSMKIENWIKSHPYHSITTYNVGSTTGVAYVKRFNNEKFLQWLKICVILLFASKIFKDHVFVPHITRWRRTEPSYSPL